MREPHFRIPWSEWGKTIYSFSFFNWGSSTFISQKFSTRLFILFLILEDKFLKKLFFELFFLLLTQVEHFNDQCKHICLNVEKSNFSILRLFGLKNHFKKIKAENIHSFWNEKNVSFLNVGLSRPLYGFIFPFITQLISFTMVNGNWKR